MGGKGGPCGRRVAPENEFILVHGHRPRLVHVSLRNRFCILMGAVTTRDASFWIISGPNFHHENTDDEEFIDSDRLHFLV